MLKKVVPIIFVSLLLILSACSKHDYSNKFSFEPENPKQGSEVTVLFNAKGTQLENADQVYLVTYQFNKELQSVDEYKMTREKEGWFAKFKTGNDIMGVFVKFTNGNEIFDNNEKAGYLIELYSEDGNKVRGVKAGIAAAYSNWIRNLDIDADRNKAYIMFNEAFKEDSTLKREFINDYLNLTASLAGQNALMLIKAELEYLESLNDLNEDELAALAFWYGKTPTPEKAEKYKELSLEKYPKGIVAQRELYDQFNKATNIDDQLNIIHKYKTKFPDGDYNEPMAFGVLRKTLQDKNYDMALMVIQHAGEDLHPFYFGYAASQMLEGNYDPKKIKLVLDAGISKGQNEVGKPDSEKPKTLTLSDWRKSSKYYLGTNYAAMGKLLEKTEDKAGAVEAYGKSIELTKDFYSSAEINEAYVRLLVELGRESDAMPFLETLVKKGEATEKMKDDLKKCYLKIKGSEEEYEKYLDELEGVANTELVSKLKKEMIEEDAPDFTLTDLNGKEITLSALKGKTVIVDFWATWCGPCKKSFPGMKRAVEKFAGDENVRFLFVNTWERVEDKKENALNFIKENNYPFQVLLDDENKVVELFKVEGIPTKFIIDKNGKIRFKSIGFSGNADALVDELSAMITMLK